jgi:hypothetical protein
VAVRRHGASLRPSAESQFAPNAYVYIQEGPSGGSSENVRKIFERFEFDKEIEKLEEANRLYQIVSKFADVNLHPEKLDNIQMGLLFEDLIRRFNEAANETAGDHFTPREVIRLMTCKLFDNDDFGYRRVTVERPLRLRFQVTTEAKESFLDACPEFLDAVLAMVGAGRETAAISGYSWAV